MSRNKYITDNAPILLAGLFNSEIDKSKRLDVAIQSASNLYDRLHELGHFKKTTVRKKTELKMSPERSKWFERFWDAFSDKKRSSKKEARLVFSNMELNPDLAELIIYGAGKSYDEAKIGGLSFRKQAHSWLNAELYLGYKIPPKKELVEANNELLELKQEIAHFESLKGSFAESEVKRLKEKLNSLNKD